jgi:uncharacterized protein YcnI
VNGITTGRRVVAVLVAAGTALVVVASASAHAHVSPPVVQAKSSYVFTVAVPTEKENLTTSKIEMTPPKGFSIDSFVDAPGWKRTVQKTGSGDSAVVTKVTWEGGKVPTGDATGFQFLGSTDASKTYTFAVRQTYSDGSVVDWSGPESGDTPAPVVEAKGSVGGGGGTSAFAIVALIVAIIGLVVGSAALLVRQGGRPVA